MNLAIDNLFNFCWSIVTTGVLNLELLWDYLAYFACFQVTGRSCYGFLKAYLKTLGTFMYIKVDSFNYCFAVLKK